ncbi:MAG: hypothetical protein VKP62_10310 [Candidatus Sericytochromatia bacterium]|nr:hypothetical protein [Candidatus Sericytochromatia bacterium]
MRARRTERFEATLIALAAHVESLGFAGRGGYYAWDRLKHLVRGLHAALDYYELEGDVAPARRELEAYHRDMAGIGLPPDAWVEAELGRLLGELEAPVTWELSVGETPPGAPQGYPEGILAVHPAALDMLARRASPSEQPAG